MNKKGRHDDLMIILLNTNCLHNNDGVLLNHLFQCVITLNKKELNETHRESANVTSHSPSHFGLVFTSLRGVS
jgi:hypothetical protein